MEQGYFDKPKPVLNLKGQEIFFGTDHEWKAWRTKPFLKGPAIAKMAPRKRVFPKRRTLEATSTM
jgi:hypothetical protein